MHKRPEYTRVKLRKLRKETYGKDSFKGKPKLTYWERKKIREERKEILDNLFELFDKVKKL